MKKTRILSGPLAAVTLALSLIPTTVAGGKIKDVISEIEGDTQCIARAERHFYTWMDYNDTMAGLLKRGEPYDRESMKWEADFERRASWRQPERKLSYVHLALGRVDGEENTRFGAIPPGADIAVGYLHDWSVHDRYGYGSDHQPRVESVTEIVIKPEFSATIEYVNDIQMIAKGSISGTAAAAQPWPQQGEHDAALTAIDIHGKQHRLNISARATAMPTNARSRSNSQSSTTKWTVSGGVSVSSGGPSGNIGGSYEETETVSSSRSRSTSVPAVPGAVYNKDYSDGTTKVVKIECGGVSRVSRAVQINGHFYTKSFRQGGSVSSSGTHGVTNGLRIKVSCRPCEGRPGGDPSGEPSDPSGTPRDPNGPITPSGDSGYGSKQPDPLEPKERNGVTVTPSQGGASDPSSFWDNPIIKGGGCIYIDPRYLPPFIEPVEQGALGDPGFDPEDLDVGPDKIPLVVPDGGGASDDDTAPPLVPFGYLHPGSRIQPDPDTVVVVNPGSNLVTIDGGFRVVAPQSTANDYFQAGASIRFRTGSVARIDGPFEIAALDGTAIRVVEQEGIRLHQLIDEEAGDPTLPPLLHGQVVEDLAHPGAILFSRFTDVESPDPVVQSEVDLNAQSCRTEGGEFVIDFHAAWPDVPIVVQRMSGPGEWTEVAEFPANPEGNRTFEFRSPLGPAKGANIYRASVVPQRPRLAQPLGPESLDHMIEGVRFNRGGTPEEIEHLIQTGVIPLFDLNLRIRELEVLVESGDLDPIATGLAEMQLAELLAARIRDRGALERADQTAPGSD
jgi:hypothetical protein